MTALSPRPPTNRVDEAVNSTERARDSNSLRSGEERVRVHWRSETERASVPARITVVVTERGLEIHPSSGRGGKRGSGGWERKGSW